MTGKIRIAIIVAAAENGVIGRNGDLPWRMPSDLKRFRAMTLGKPVVMGRKTFQSLKKPLDGRDNIVVSRDATYRPEGATVVASLETALDFARECAARRGADEIMIIGGAQIYAQALPQADRVYLTRVHASPVGDAVFPDLDPLVWRETSADPHPRGPNDQFAATNIVFDRISVTC